MAAYTLTATLALRYTAPGGSTINSAVVVTVPYDGLESAIVDIPDETAAETEYELSFGSVESPTAVFVSNTGNQDLGVRINTAVADEYQIAPGTGQLIAMPAAAGANPITALSLVTTVEQDGAGSFEYIIFG